MVQIPTTLPALDNPNSVAPIGVGNNISSSKGISHYTTSSISSCASADSVYTPSVPQIPPYSANTKNYMPQLIEAFNLLSTLHTEALKLYAANSLYNSEKCTEAYRTLAEVHINEFNASKQNEMWEFATYFLASLSIFSGIGMINSGIGGYFGYLLIASAFAQICNKGSKDAGFSTWLTQNYSDDRERNEALAKNIDQTIDALAVITGLVATYGTGPEILQAISSNSILSSINILTTFLRTTTTVGKGFTDKRLQDLTKENKLQTGLAALHSDSMTSCTTKVKDEVNSEHEITKTVARLLQKNTEIIKKLIRGS